MTFAWIPMPGDETTRRVIADFAGGETGLVVIEEPDDQSVGFYQAVLVRRWVRLREWIDDNRETLRTREFLRANRAIWLARGRDPSLLNLSSRDMEAARTLCEQPGDVATDDIGTTSKRFSIMTTTTAGSREAKQRDELEAAQRLAEERPQARRPSAS